VDRVAKAWIGSGTPRIIANMDTWDWILLLWWLLAAVAGLTTVGFVRRGDRIGRSEAFHASVQGGAGRYGGYHMSEARLPRPLSVVYIVLWVLLTIGILALLWGSYSNPRTMTNMFVFVILFGGVFVGASLSSSILPSASNKWIKAHAYILRPILALAGVAMIGYASYVLFEDFTELHAVVEGRITKLSTDVGHRRSATYFAYIGGHPFMITRDVQSQLVVGQQVRAELTAGSNVIVQATASTPVPRTMR
jgi:hypothetical protein